MSLYCKYYLTQIWWNDEKKKPDMGCERYLDTKEKPCCIVNVYEGALWMINVEIESCGIIVTGSVYACEFPSCYTLIFHYAY